MRRAYNSYTETGLVDLETKIEFVTQNLSKNTYNLLINMSNKENSLIIANYILALRTEVNVSVRYQTLIIKLLTYFNKFNKETHFGDANRENVLSFLQSYRKPEALDLQHKWVGTYNLYKSILIVKS